MPVRRVGKIAALMWAALTLIGCSGLAPVRSVTTLTYIGPTEVYLIAGQALRPTDLVFIGVQDRRGQFIIDDMKATRQLGDSLDWDGEPLPGVRLSLRLRVIWFRDNGVHLAGTVRIEVHDFRPSPGGFNEDAPIQYKVPVAYRIPRGGMIPGTTLTYVGPSARGAELGGLAEYPFRKIADSILWEGRLRPNVGLALNLRMVYFDEQAMQVIGIATIALEESQAAYQNLYETAGI
ncbi:MAG: hypothetical protein RML36_02010 [Anaerolineae bacterium]|nr:hypothetical protein [Anaerolineae bacterium]MDW8098243.1 hypothetical protein [Anaerolineae bacterium]